MVNGTRWIALDDDSMAFKFAGDWRAEPGKFAHLDTLWTTTDTKGSSTSFLFNGTEIDVIVRVKGGGGESLPTSCCCCTVDNNPTTLHDGANREVFTCTWKGGERIGDGSPHKLLLSVSLPGGSRAPLPLFAVDAVWYLPAPDSGPLPDASALVSYDNNDPHIEYTAGRWEPLKHDGKHAMGANETGSSARFLFFGTKVTWEGWTLGSGASSGIYYIDGSEPISFHVASESDSIAHGAKLIGLDDLSDVAHNLTVVHTGGTPLVLDQLLVRDGDYRIMAELPTPSMQRPNSNASGSSTPPATSQSQSDSSSDGVQAGAIAGGVIG
ncbi:hypothetical protein BKA70DRAFT_1400923, partial [Coprinopsis sp. MPI-PUGE-AT-0042]